MTRFIFLSLLVYCSFIRPSTILQAIENDHRVAPPLKGIFEGSGNADSAGNTMAWECRVRVGGVEFTQMGEIGDSCKNTIEGLQKQKKFKETLLSDDILFKALKSSIKEKEDLLWKNRNNLSNNVGLNLEIQRLRQKMDEMIRDAKPSKEGLRTLCRRIEFEQGCR